MAWAALIPIAAQLLKGEEKPQAPTQMLPPQPTLGEKLEANQAKYSGPSFGSRPVAETSNPFSQLSPVGGRSRG